MRLDKIPQSEFYTGLAVAAVFWRWIDPVHRLFSWRVLCVALVCGTLWALGGSLKKSYRRWGVPGVITIAFAAAGALSRDVSGVVTGLSFFLWLHLVCRLGYGIPSLQPKDEGSRIGRFWADYIVRRDEEIEVEELLFISNILTRATVGLSFGIAGAVIGGWMWGAVVGLALALALPFIWILEESYAENRF